MKWIIRSARGLRI